jgi:hypothetical protein
MGHGIACTWSMARRGNMQEDTGIIVVRGHERCPHGEGYQTGKYKENLHVNLTL